MGKIQIKYEFKRKLNDKESFEIKGILKMADTEFVPPLSSRHSTTETDLSGEYVSDKGIDEYYDKIKLQSFLLCKEKGHIVGFMSFITDHEVWINNTEIQCLYLSTLIVNPDYRRKHLARGVTCS